MKQWAIECHVSFNYYICKECLRMSKWSRYNIKRKQDFHKADANSKKEHIYTEKDSENTLKF